ncbi:hypothetical protein RI367_002027 [Sorochytrium milnesiophthora]
MSSYKVSATHPALDYNSFSAQDQSASEQPSGLYFAAPSSAPDAATAEQQQQQQQQPVGQQANVGFMAPPQQVYPQPAYYTDGQYYYPMQDAQLQQQYAGSQAFASQQPVAGPVQDTEAPVSHIASQSQVGLLSTAAEQDGAHAASQVPVTLPRNEPTATMSKLDMASPPPVMPKPWREPRFWLVIAALATSGLSLGLACVARNLFGAYDLQMGINSDFGSPGLASQSDALALQAVGGVSILVAIVILTLSIIQSPRQLPSDAFLRNQYLAAFALCVADLAMGVLVCTADDTASRAVKTFQYACRPQNLVATADNAANLGKVCTSMRTSVAMAFISSLLWGAVGVFVLLLIRRLRK